MDFSNVALFNVMKSKLNYMSARQSVLAQNVANADTPGYRAKDIQTPDFKAMAMAASAGSAQKLPLTVTDPKHIVPITAGEGYKTQKRKNTYELNPDENNVVIEEEMMKVAENQAEYQKVLNLYTKTVGMFKTAIGRSGNGG